MPWSRTTLGTLATSAAVITGLIAVPLLMLTIGGGQRWPAQHRAPATSPPLIARAPERGHQRQERRRRRARAVATPASAPVALPPGGPAVSTVPVSERGATAPPRRTRRHRRARPPRPPQVTPVAAPPATVSAPTPPPAPAVPVTPVTRPGRP